MASFVRHLDSGVADLREAIMVLSLVTFGVCVGIVVAIAFFL